MNVDAVLHCVPELGPRARGRDLRKGAGGTEEWEAEKKSRDAHVDSVRTAFATREDRRGKMSRSSLR